MSFNDPLAMPDPFQIANPFGVQQVAQQRSPALPPLSPQDESSLLERIGQAGLGGLSWLGGMLNKPGRAVRGLLGGTPREALNLIPFSDALGITDPTQEVRGQDLIGADKDTSFFSPEGLAGFGVDVLTDPLSYLSFGGSALSRAGQAAKKAGTLPGTISERVAQGLGGHVGVGLPFGGNAATFDLAPAGRAIKSGLEALPGGQMVSDLAGGLAGKASELYTKTIPPLFQGSVMGRKTKVGQDVARAITEGTPEAIANANMAAMPIAQRAHQLGLAGDDAASLLRSVGETGLGGTVEHQELLRPMQDELARLQGLKQQIGLPAPELAQQTIQAGAGEGSLLGYLPRERTNMEPISAAQHLKTKSIAPAPEFGRKDWTAGLTTESLNRIATEDLSIAGSAMNPAQQVQKTIGEKFLGISKHDHEVQRLEDIVTADKLAHQGIVTDTDALQNLTNAQAVRSALSNQAAELARIKMSGSFPQFLNHPIRDFATKIAKDNVQLLKAQEVYRGLAGATVEASHDTVPLMDALAGLWKPQDVAVASLAGGGHTAPLGAQATMQEALTKAGVTGKLADLHVPAEVAQDLAGLSKMHSINGMEEFTKVWDSLTNLTKAGQTMFPSTVVRNAGQDVFNKIVYGMHDPSFSPLNPMRYTQPIADWSAIANGKTLDGLAEKLKGVKQFQGMTDQAAADELRRLYSAWDVGRDNFKRTAVQDFGADIGGQAQHSLDGLLPISKQQNPLAAYVGGLKGGDLNPLGVSGFMGKMEDTFKPVKAMRAANNASDNLMRGSSFLAKLEQGFEPASAFREVMKAHYDFGNLSQFEKGVMKRVVPFYSWARQNIPAVVQEIAELPGGKLATAVKGTVAMRGEHPGFMPGYIGEGVAAPIGAEENGQQRYLSRLGLGFEDLGQLAGPGGPLGMLNPIIKAPVEALTGKQMFTGRDLRDLHSRLGDLTGQPLPGAENLLMNSPVGRVISTAGTLADDRKSIADKALNLLTGARLTDVDVEAARRNAVRDFVQQNLHGPGVSHFEELSVRPDNLPLLTPAERQLYQLHQALRSRRPLP